MWRGRNRHISRLGRNMGPLFLNFDRARKGRRLTGAGLYALVRKLGKSVGVETWPHGLRHTAITEALNLTQGDVRAVQRFSRHRDLQTLVVYDDNRVDLGGEVAKLVAENGGKAEKSSRGNGGSLAAQLTVSETKSEDGV